MDVRKADVLPPPPYYHNIVFPVSRECPLSRPLIPHPPAPQAFAYNPTVGRMIPVVPTFSSHRPCFAPLNNFPPNPHLLPNHRIIVPRRPACNYTMMEPPQVFPGCLPLERGHADVKKNGKKGYRYDSRGQHMMDQDMRNLKTRTLCRIDIHMFDDPFLAIFESLIPVDEEKIKQKQLLAKLGNIIVKEWPEAQLRMYGSSENLFGFSSSDIDVSLELEDDKEIDKARIVLKLADLVKSENFQDVKAIPNARIPVLKFVDPVTGISCDICINNAIAVANTKLLRDYAQIDVRLRQLAFIVKHWAKSRRVNETYQGTLSSYAYVLMCINFLQQRSSPILPCLQRMESTYSKKVGNLDCSYFDQVEKLQNFGVENSESIAQLVWEFFHYWAYCHDYKNDVISVCTGGTLRKSSKGWNKRVGYECHLISIEDPFEVSNDLSRGVDRNSIRVLREEFERAAEIMGHDSSPFETLFEPYVPN